jgi:hypothetical protein
MSGNVSIPDTSPQSWPTTTARVISSQYKSPKLRDIDTENYIDNSYFIVTFSYTVNNQLFVDTFEAYIVYEVGQEFELAYDPKNPKSNNCSMPPESIQSKILFWLAAITGAILLFYLSRKFGWEDWGD